MKSLWRPKSLKHQKSILGEHQTHLNVNKKLLVFTFFFSYIYSVIDVVVSLNSGNQNEVGYTAIMVAVVFQFMRLILFLLHISRGFGTNPKRVFLMELIFIIVYGAGVLSTWNIQMTIDPSRAYVVGLEAGWTFLYVHTLFNQWPWKAIIYIGVSIFGICKTLSDFGEFNMGPIQAAIQIILVLTSAFIEEHRRRQKLLHSLSLEKTGQTLRNILNSLPDNIAILNLQGDIRFYNEYFGISFQLTEDMSSAKLFSEIYQVKPRDRHLNLKKLQDRYNFVRPMPRRTTRTFNGVSRKPTRRSTLVKANNNNNSPLMRYLTEEFEISKTAGDRILDPKEPKGPIQVGRSMRFSQLGPLKTLTEFFASIKHFKDLQEVLEFFCLNVDIIRTYTEKERSFFIFDAKYNTSEGVLKSFEIKISLSSFDSEDSFIIILRDTTHRDIIVTLEDKNDFKDSVLSSISHELRTPLNTNLNLLQLAIDAYTRSNKPPNNPTMITNQDNIDGTEISTTPAQDLKDIYLIPAHKSGKLLGYLINDIVDYSMLIARKFVANGKEKYLLKSLEKIRYLCEFQAREKNLEFHISISQDLNFKVGTDHRRLRQILINLVNNAIRFTNKGFVNLRIEPYNDNPDLIQFTVRDSGIGITQENLERMAALLDSGNFLNKLNKESSGVGMGLIISHLLAKELGPTALRMAGIKIESTLGEGSKFSFIIENWIRLADKTPSRQNDSARLDSARTTGFLRKPSMAIARITGERTDLSIGNPKKEQQVDSAILGNEEEIDEEIAKMIKDDNFKLNVTENKLFKENSSPLFGSKNVSKIFLNVSDLPSSGILQRGRLESVSSPDYIVDPANPLILHTHSNRTHKEDLPKMCTCPEILVVDDDMFNLFTMENLLGTIKYRIAKATNGEEAVEAVRKRKDLKCSDQCKMFKLIFMDLSMPIMDGFQATFKLKHMMKNREVEKIPIIACTAFVDQENTEKCFEYGMEGKISKPVNKNKLKECLRKYAMIVNDDED